MRITKEMMEKLKQMNPEQITATIEQVKAETPKGSVASCVEEFNGFFGELDKLFQNRETEIEQLKAALLLREHMLITGKPGTGKSQLARTLFHHITNGEGAKARVFEIQFSKFMSEDYVFGPINIKKMREEGIIEHHTEGTIVDADFAFIDEAFDGSDVLLRSLLEIMNERTFTRNKQQIKCNLHTAVLTSNWQRDEESTEAFLDRILFRANVAPLSLSGDRVRMYKNYLANTSNGIIPMERRLPISAIKKLAQEIHNVDVDNETLKYYDSVLREFIKQTGIYISDRTANKMLNLLRMKALLESRASVTPEDIQVIGCALHGREPKSSSDIKSDEIFKAVYEKQVVEGRVEAIESKQLKPFMEPVKRLRGTVFDADKEKNILRLVEAENKEIEGLEKVYESLQTEKCKKQVESLIEELKSDIERAKNELLGNLEKETANENNG